MRGASTISNTGGSSGGFYLYNAGVGLGVRTGGKGATGIFGLGGGVDEVARQDITEEEAFDLLTTYDLTAE